MDHLSTTLKQKKKTNIFLPEDRFSEKILLFVKQKIEMIFHLKELNKNINIYTVNKT